jgi:glycosyltransferase involved in cell wall biosynthesis
MSTIKRISTEIVSKGLIAIFVPSVRGGGAERAMLVFAHELVVRGFRVDLVLTNLDGALEDIIPRGVRVVNLKCSRTIAALPGLVRYLKKHKPKALYATIMNANVIAAFAGRLAQGDTKIVLRESNAPITSPKKSVARWATYKIAPFAYRMSQGIIAVSEGVAQELVAMDRDMTGRIHVVPTPVVSDNLLALAQEPVDHPWMVNRDRPVLVSAGRLERHKGFMTLLRAFARLREKLEARLIVLGDGSMREKLEAELVRLGIKDDVELVGFKKNPFRFMKQADLFVLASEYEGLPNVLVQAMALGTRIVSTDCRTGPAEILCNGKFGRLVPVGDEELLAKAMQESLQKPRESAGQIYALERYGASKATADYLAIVGLA